MATTERLATGEAKPVDLAAGDTLIRPLDMRDPVDRTLAETAIGRADASVIIPDPERQDPPPIDLPDYVPPDRDVQRDEWGDNYVARRWGLAIMLAVAVAFVLAVVLIARETSFVTWVRG